VTPRVATFGVFVVNGAMLGTWVAHIPWTQDQLGLSKGTIGLTLLCMAAGALVAMPLTGRVLERRSSARVTRAAGLCFCMLLPLPLLAGGPVALGALLAVFGAANGAMDVAMNAHGVAVERHLGRPVLSSLHGGWSIGGFAGAACAALAAAAGLDPRLESALVAAVLVLAMAWLATCLGELSAHATPGEGGGLALPSRPVLLLGALCFLAMMTEGAIADWSGIYLRQDLGTGTAAAATGFAAFSLGMAVSRLTGDVLNERLGPRLLLRAGMSLVAVALALGLLVGRAAPSVAAFALVGVGIANAVPLLFSAAGRIPPSGPSLAAAFTVGYTGFIVGPPVIGFLSQWIGLPPTLGLLSLVSLAVVLLGGRALGPATAAESEVAAA
jgi:predicted MFS family arabinose efflux permease